MQSAVLARGIPSVCLSVTFRYCVQMNEDTIVRFSASGRTIPPVSGEVKFIRIFARGCTSSGGVKVKSHMGFRLLRKSVTVNDLERRYFAEFGKFLRLLRKSG